MGLSRERPGGLCAAVGWRSRGGRPRVCVCVCVCVRANKLPPCEGLRKRRARQDCVMRAHAHTDLDDPRNGSIKHLAPEAASASPIQSVRLSPLDWVSSARARARCPPANHFRLSQRAAPTRGGRSMSGLCQIDLSVYAQFAYLCGSASRRESYLVARAPCK